MVERDRDRLDELDEDLMEDEDAQKDKYLTFRIADEDYAIDISFVQEIIRIQKITVVPDTANYLKGVINLRGKVIPVIDVRLRFGLHERDYDDRTCIIVVNMSDVVTGLIVDRVSEVLNIPENQMDPAPKTGKKDAGKFIKAMGKMGDAVKIVLDINHLLSYQEINDLKEIAEE